jgi:hypothetical protein
MVNTITESWEQMKDRLIPEKRPMYFNRKGESITLDEWVLLRINPEYTLIKNEEISKNWLLSVVWSGFSASFSEPPLIFDIILFDKRGGDNYNMHTEKAATEVEALKIFEYLKKNYLNIEAATSVYLGYVNRMLKNDKKK